MRFSSTTKNKARFRQWGRCGFCGDNLDYIEEHAHHIVPDSLGGKNEPSNCVILCETCRERAHNDGNYISRVVAPREYFRYYYGGR